jgi:hypothetical protein
MKALAFLLALIAFAAGCDASFALLLRGNGSTGGGGTGPPPAGAPVSVEIPQIGGLDYPPAGSTVTLTAQPGTWTNSPTSHTYSWHKPDGTVLGTGTSLTLTTPGAVGTIVELDDTATNASGSATRTSHWFGPIASSAPVGPTEWEVPGNGATQCDISRSTDGSNYHYGCGPTSLPTSPARFIENMHAVFPGCTIPPQSPNLSAGHLWYFDPIKGKTQANGGNGSLASPYKDIAALTTDMTGSGYASSPLFGVGGTTVIHPGDTIYIEPGDATHPVGSLSFTGGLGYSTSDGTQSGTTAFTWIMGDPAAASKPVINQITYTGGAIGFIYQHIAVEPPTVGASRNAIVFTGASSAIDKDIYLEDISINGWPGHANDPWEPSHWPNSGGSSDGRATTGSPGLSQSFGQDIPSFSATMALHATTVTTSAGVKVGNYIWSANSWQTNGSATPTSHPTGIPNGTVVKSISGTTVTLGPCDPVADADTGCPTSNYPGLSTNIPGCDPLTSYNVGFGGGTAGGCGGSPVAWNGATRAISGENLQYSDRMVITPAGYYSPWDYGSGTYFGVWINGVVDSSGAFDQTNSPNIITKSKCFSIKDSWFRNVNDAVNISRTTNTVFYNNRVKFVAQDAFEVWSSHRVWVIHNLITDSTVTWGHQDSIQFANSGSPAYLKFWYNSAAIENEIVQFTDYTNYYPRQWQAPIMTDLSWWGTYVADNVVIARTNGLQIMGRWNVVANNDVFGQTAYVGYQKKDILKPPTNNSPDAQDMIPVHSLLANNLANGSGRNPINNASSQGANIGCNQTTGDLDTILTNISLPYVNSGGVGGSNLNYHCFRYETRTDDVLGNANIGEFEGLSNWTGGAASDWRSDISGVSPLLIGYDPQPLPTAGQPGYGLWTDGMWLTCLQMSIIPFECPAGSQGILNPRPNPSWVGPFPYHTLAASVTRNNQLPSGQPDNTVILNIGSPGTGSWVACTPGQPLPSKAYPTSTCPTTPQSGTTVNYAGGGPNCAGTSCSLAGPYTPPIVGGGTALGAQMPLVDLDGKAWKSPPSVGAYEVGAAVATDPTAIVIAPSGSDSNPCTAASPCLTPGKAQTVARGASDKLIYARAGTYSNVLLTLTTSDNGETWSYYPPDGYNSAIFDGGATSANASSTTCTKQPFTLLATNNITITGLTIQNFQAWGIGIHGGETDPNGCFPQATMAAANNNSFTNNIIQNGYVGNNNAGWAGGGIWIQGQVTNLTVSHNVVQNQYGSGIRASADGDGASPNDNLSGLSIINNAVLNTDQKTGDNGAIYFQDQTGPLKTGGGPSNSTNISIKNNFIRDYQTNPVGSLYNGQAPTRDVAIYIDRGGSNATVSGNIIANTAGTYAADINSSTIWMSTNAIFHSGANNTFSGNIIDLGNNGWIFNAIYEQYQSTDIVTGNSVTGNIFLGKWAGSQATAGWGQNCNCAYLQGGPSPASVNISHNLYYDYGAGTMSTSGNGISDASPVTGTDPLISGTTYTLSSSSPALGSPVNFPPIIGGWGPPSYVIPATGTPPSSTVHNYWYAATSPECPSSSGSDCTGYPATQGYVRVYDIDQNFARASSLDFNLPTTVKGLRGLFADSTGTHMYFPNYGTTNVGANTTGARLMSWNLTSGSADYDVSYSLAAIDRACLSADNTTIYAPSGENVQTGAYNSSWYVITAATGAQTGTIALTSGAVRPHNTECSANKIYMAAVDLHGGVAGKHNVTMYNTSSHAQTVCGPFTAGDGRVRPFDVDFIHDLVYVNLEDWIGFAVCNGATGAVLYDSQAPPSYTQPGTSNVVNSHGIAVTPDGNKLYVADPNMGAGSSTATGVEVWDVSGVRTGSAPVYKKFIATSKDTHIYDGRNPGWMDITSDSKFLVVETGEVISTATDAVVTQLADPSQSDGNGLFMRTRYFTQVTK